VAVTLGGIGFSRHGFSAERNSKIGAGGDAVSGGSPKLVNSTHGNHALQ